MTTPTLTVEEKSILRLYLGENMTRKSALGDLERCLEYVSDNLVWELCSGLITKLDAMSDQDFAALDLSDALVVLES